MNNAIEIIAKKIFMFDELLDMSYSEQYSSEEILKLFKEKYFEKEWEKLKEELKKHPDHFGDCTGEACPCARCIYERYLEEAKEELDKFNGFNLK